MVARPVQDLGVSPSEGIAPSPFASIEVQAPFSSPPPTAASGELSTGQSSKDPWETSYYLQKEQPQIFCSMDNTTPE